MKKTKSTPRATPRRCAVSTGSGISAVLTKSFSLARLVERCQGKRDRECIYRLFKEASIIEQDFEAAVNLRALQFENKPTRFPNNRGEPTAPRTPSET